MSNSQQTEDSTNPAGGTEDPGHEMTLVDELGVQDLDELLYAKHGRIFSAAGRQSPVAEFTDDYVVLHPPQKPLEEEGPSENISIMINDKGILLDELNKERKISGAKYEGLPLFWLGQRKPGTFKHYVGFFRDDSLYKLLSEGQPATTEQIYKLRNRSVNGELSTDPELSFEPA